MFAVSVLSSYDSGNSAPSVEVSRNLRLLPLLCWEPLLSCESRYSPESTHVGMLESFWKLEPLKVLLSISCCVNVFVFDPLIQSLSRPMAELSLFSYELVDPYPVCRD